VGDSDSLRAAGGAGGEDDVCDVVRVCLRDALDQAPRIGVSTHVEDVCDGGHRQVSFAVVETQAPHRLHVAQQALDALRWIPGVQRDGDRSDPPQGQHRGEVLRAAGHHQADGGASRHSLPHEAAGQHCNHLLELAVRQ
jgi:hypothetical protein